MMITKKLFDRLIYVFANPNRVILLGTAILMSMLQLRGSQALQGGQSAEAKFAYIADAIASPSLHYQGRLVDGLGNAKPDGTYAMLFRLYTSASGGGPTWSETKSVAVVNGTVNTQLGDTALLNLSTFNGQALWLGVTVGADPEMVPRQRLSPVAYALFANEAGNAISLGGQGASAYVLDTDLKARMQLNDGPGSGLDGDTLDGLDSSAFAPAAHNHDGRYFARIRGTQFTGNLGSGGSITWFTHSWPSDQVVVWSVLPTTNNGTVTWSVRTELEPGAGIKYYITVNNVGAGATDYAGHYAVLP